VLNNNSKVTITRLIGIRITITIAITTGIKYE
jgi:hypothetical protein